MNRAEVAVDIAFDSPAECADGFDFIHGHFVRRWHSKRHEIKLYGERGTGGQTRYDAWNARNLLVVYGESHSRITGELNCLHVEWRLNGVRAVRSAGINTPADIRAFDHHGFWRKRLVLYSVEAERLGRMVRNRMTGKRSRRGEIGKDWRGRSINLDIRLGGVLVNSVDTIQELMDRYSGTYRLHRVLGKIANTGLLSGLDSG